MTGGHPPRDYDGLIAREAAHWSGGERDPRERQIWDDPALFETFFGREYRRFVERVLAAGTDVLELGCGDGILACELVRAGATVTGVDLSPERIERARARAAALPPGRAVFLTGDLNRMPLPEARFDAVAVHDALHHVFDLDGVLERAARSLRAGGRLVILEYIGMGRGRRLAAAALTALLPTHRSYAQKWALRTRLAAFLATEEAKRAAVAAGGGASLHPDSPFEEISQVRIPAAVAQRFEIIEENDFNPFWFYIAPKVRVPRRLVPRVASVLRRTDDMIIRLRLCRGAYVFMEARPR